jgi:hypothetical protein
MTIDQIAKDAREWPEEVVAELVDRIFHATARRGPYSLDGYRRLWGYRFFEGAWNRYPVRERLATTGQGITKFRIVTQSWSPIGGALIRAGTNPEIVHAGGGNFDVDPAMTGASQG